MKDHQNSSDEEFIRSISEFGNNNYVVIDNDRLTLFTVAFLESNNIEPTFDKIVVAAFKLFPKKFSLIGFADYPDGIRVHDCLFHCTYKSKKWLFGNAKSGYKVTERGRYFLDETKKMLDGKIKVTRKYGILPRRKEPVFVNSLKKTSAYEKYEADKKEDISKLEILEALRVSSSASIEAINKNLSKYIDYASRLNDNSVKEFLKFIKKKLRENYD